MVLSEDSSLEDYGKTEDQSLEEVIEFTPKFQLFQVFHNCLSLQAQDRYPESRKAFYDSLGWFGIMFDSIFPQRCQQIISHYDAIKKDTEITYEQAEQLKYMRILSELTIMLFDASTRRHTQLNKDTMREVEMTPIGFPQILDYRAMSLELFTMLMQMQQKGDSRKTAKFFNHSLGWFAGIFDSTFISMGYIIDQTEIDYRNKYRRLVHEFSKLLMRKSVTTAPLAQLSYKPSEVDATPRCIEDIIKEKKSKTQKGGTHADSKR